MYKHIQAPSCTFRVFPHCQGWCQDLITGQNRSRVIRVQSLVIWWWGSPFFEPYPGYPRIFFHVNIPFWGAWLCAIYIYMIMANCKWCWSLQNAEFQGPRLQSPPRWWYLARVFWALTASRKNHGIFREPLPFLPDRQSPRLQWSMQPHRSAAGSLEMRMLHVSCRGARRVSPTSLEPRCCRVRSLGSHWGVDTLW